MTRGSISYLVLFVSAVPGLVAAQTTQLVSADAAGLIGNDRSEIPSLSADGRLAAFVSGSNNLVPNDLNGWDDIFVKDLASGAITRVSVGPGGLEADHLSDDVQISADGRYVAFHSNATDLDPIDLNQVPDVFVHDRVTGTTSIASLSNFSVIGGGESYAPSISGDGRFVAFESWAANLVTNDNNGVPDVFLRDRLAGTTVRVSVGPGGAELAQQSQEPFVSADGRFVAFSSFDDGIVSFDGNGFLDVFVYEVATGAIECASIGLTGITGDEHSLSPSLSADGRFCAFMSDAQRLVHADTNVLRDVFVRDLVNDTTERVSLTSAGLETFTGLSMAPAISGDGTTVVFASLADDLVSGDTNTTFDVFVHSRLSGATSRVSLKANGGELNGPSVRNSPSFDGSTILFASSASDVVPGDTNFQNDVFVRTGFADAVVYCTGSSTTSGCHPSLTPNQLAPSIAAGPGNFVLTCTNLEGAKQGIVFYGINGRLALPWASGSSSFLCVKPPTQRTAVQNSGGTIGQCNGSLSLDFFAYTSANPGALGQPLFAGEVFDAQAWFRDPPAPKTTNLSDAVEFTLHP